MRQRMNFMQRNMQLSAVDVGQGTPDRNNIARLNTRKIFAEKGIVNTFLNKQFSQ